MSWLTRLLPVFGLFFLFFLVFPPRVYAYLDPGTGSIIIQVLIGVLVGGLAALKIYWARVKTAVQKWFSRNGKSEKSGN